MCNIHEVPVCSAIHYRMMCNIYKVPACSAIRYGMMCNIHKVPVCNAVRYGKYSESRCATYMKYQYVKQYATECVVNHDVQHT